MFFAAFATVAIILQLVHMWNVRQGNESLVGRGSTLNLVAEVPDGSRREKRSSLFSFKDKNDDDDDEKDVLRSNEKRKGSSLFSFQNEKIDKDGEDDVFIDDVAREEAKVEEVDI